MKPGKGYRWVKWPCQGLAAQLLLHKTALNGPVPCVLSPQFRFVGVRASCIYFSNSSWTPWVLDPHYKSLFGALLLATPCYNVSLIFIKHMLDLGLCVYWSLKLSEVKKDLHWLNTFCIYSELEILMYLYIWGDSENSFIFLGIKE